MCRAITSVYAGSSGCRSAVNMKKLKKISGRVAVAVTTRGPRAGSRGP